MADSQVLPTSFDEANRLLPRPVALEAKVRHSCVASPATAAASTAISGQIKYNSVIIYNSRVERKRVCEWVGQADKV